VTKRIKITHFLTHFWNFFENPVLPDFVKRAGLNISNVTKMDPFFVIFISKFSKKVRKVKNPFLDQKSSKNGSKTGFFSSNGADTEIANDFGVFGNPFLDHFLSLFGTF